MSDKTMVVDYISEEEKNNIIKSNIEYLMRNRNIPNITALAKRLDVPVTTIYSFLRNTSSNSKVKSKICDYFNINVDELECCKLLELEDNYINKRNKYFDENLNSIESMTNDEIVELLNDSNADDDQIKSLKNEILKSYKSNFRNFCEQAKTDFILGNYQRAFCSLSAAFWHLSSSEIKYIKKEHLILYIEISKKTNDEDNILKLIEKLISPLYYSEKIVAVLGHLLEKDFPDEAKICFETIVNNRI